MIPNVKTSFELLNPPNEGFQLVLLELDFLAFSPFFLKVLVLGELVAMYEIQIRLIVKALREFRLITLKNKPIIPF